MSQIRLKGFQTGAAVELSNITVGGDSRTLSVPAFRKPPRVAALPRISDAFDGTDMSVDTTGLTGITAYQWRIKGGADQGTASTQDTTGLGGDYLECVVTCDQGMLTSPAVRVYENGMMSMAAMDADDAAILELVRHGDVTHLSVADGLWTSPATWLNGKVPANGARVLVSEGTTVTYDNSEANIRLDTIRVDGTLAWALDQSTTMLVESVIGTRGSTITIGTDSANRLPAAHTAEIIISGKDYTSDSFLPTDMNISREAKMWGRGIVSQGVWRMWGNKKTTWDRANAGVPAGATSLTLENLPTGIEVGDEIVIGGTSLDYSEVLEPGVSFLALQDEYRTLTAVDGATLSWADGLVHPHDNQCPGSTRTDLHPVVMVRKGKNIKIRSEVTAPNWRRGHTACMHRFAVMDHWDVEFVDLGRTDKDDFAGIRDTDGTFRFHDNDNLLNTAYSSQSNIQSRYPIHGHHLGFGHTGARPVVANCYVEGVPGHAIVHHNCDMDFFDNAMHRFWGCGMVSESGNELGAWVGNCAMTATAGDNALNRVPKVHESQRGIAGDNFRKGYGYGMRGRAMRVNRNVAVSCSWGYVFFHRFEPNASQAIAKVINLTRQFIDLKDVGRLVQYNDGSISDASRDFKFVHYPIVHFADNEAISCISGLFVSKSLPPQVHDVNVKLKRFKSWGYRDSGCEIEYVGTYILEDFDCVADKNGNGKGIKFGNNTFQMFTVRARVEGNSEGIFRQGAEPNMEGSTDAMSMQNPRWGHIGTDYVDNAEDLTDDGAFSSVNKAVDVTLEDPDWTGDFINYDATPSLTYPMQAGIWDGTSAFSGDLISTMSNADGAKSDNIGNAASLAPKEIKFEYLFGSFNRQVRKANNADGYWSYNGDFVVAQTNIISDRATGRPFKFLNTYVAQTEPASTGVNNGPLVYASTPVVQSDKTATVAANGTVVVNVLAGATGAGGPGTYVLDTGDHLKPDNGVARLNSATGEITYTPDRDYIGTDEMYVFVKSQNRYATVRVTFLIGSGGTVSAPQTDTHFSVADHPAANTLGVTLNTAPATGGRRIQFVQYSTDGGASWRRLCNGWPQAVHKITTTSTGTALAAGDYTLRLRYKTNFDYVFSGASSDTTVTVS